MYSLQPQDALRKTSVIKSNLLSATRVDIDSLVRCLQTDKSEPKSRSRQKLSSNKQANKNKLSRGYFPNKYKLVEPALRIKFNQIEHKQILVPSQVQVQAHIVNVSFGVNKRKKSKKPQIQKLPLSLSRPKTSTHSRQTAFLADWSQGKQISLKSSQNRYRQKVYSPTKIRVEQVQFTNEQIVTLNPTLTMINKSNHLISKDQEQQQQTLNRQLYEKTYGVAARKSAPLNSKTASLKKQFFYKRKFMLRKDPFSFSLEGKRNTADNKVELYRDFLWKINFSNALYVDAELEFKKPYKVYIGGGNNSMLVKSLMKRRYWWVIVDKLTDDVNFVWTQLKVQSVYKSQIKSSKVVEVQKLIDHNKSVTSSTIDYSKYLHTRQQSSLTANKYIKIFQGQDLQLWNQHYFKNYKTQSTINDRTYFKRIPLMKKKHITSIQKSDKLIIHNHLKSNSYIGNKKAMFYNIKLYYNLMNKDVFRNLPITFHIIKGVNDFEFKKFSQVYLNFQKQKLKRGSNNIKNVWIMKPGQFTNRGKGITVCATLEDIVSRLKGKQKNADGSVRTFILQKYIEKPFLYFKRKFDIRHYMMITCVNKKIKGYWYEEGYIRTTSTEYNIKNCKNNYIHLTNDAVQKNSQDYGKYEKGNKLSYQDFQKYLDYHYQQDKFSFFQTVIPEMKRIAGDAIKSTYSLLDSQRLEHNFQVFGLDFMIDENFTTYLIQINTNPCLELSSPLLAKIIPGMLSNALMISLDPLFPPPYNWPSHKKYQLSDNPLETNKFELIFDQNVDGPELMCLYSNIKKIDDRMGNIDDEEQEYPEEQGEWNEQIL